jgi:hypothetical protein
MNQRLKQITGQVLDELVPETWTRLGYDKIKEIQLRTAELIIKECAEIADKAEPYKASDLIKKHFGLEET